MYTQSHTGSVQLRCNADDDDDDGNNNNNNNKQKKKKKLSYGRETARQLLHTCLSTRLANSLNTAVVTCTTWPR